MRKRSGQVHSRESSATLQLTVSLLYRQALKTLAFSDKCVYNRVKEAAEFADNSSNEHEMYMK